MSGRGASHDDLAGARFGTGGVKKGSVAADMQSHADIVGEGKGLVSGLKSCGARGEGITGDDLSRSTMDSPGFGRDGAGKNSLGSQTMNEMDKFGARDQVKASLPSIGVRK